MPNPFPQFPRTRFILIAFAIIACFVFIAPVGIIFAQNTVTLPNPLGENVTTYQLASNIIKGILGFLGLFALINFIIAGIGIITSSGNSEKLKKHKDNLLWTVIGIALILGAYALVAFVLDTLSGNIS